MHRPVRPKSAKGKTRPTPPTRPRVESRTTGSSTSNSNNNGRTAEVTTSERKVYRRTNNAGASYSSSRKKERSREQDDATNYVDPSDLPDITRPVSSLSKFGILPTIPATPGTGATRNVSPVESELEMDLLSSFAQQMIIDSATMTGNTIEKSPVRSKPVETHKYRSGEPSNSQNMQKFSLNSNAQSKITPKTNPKPPTSRNIFNHPDGPSRKKSRTSSTMSVFNRSGHPSKIHPEPGQGQERLKLALKFPDGKRVERYFSPKDTINDVMNFAQTKMRIAAKNCDIYSMVQVPKVLINDWKQTLERLDMRDRTVLYIDKKDLH